MATYFIADQHFGAQGENEQKYVKFSKFIENIRSADSLFIVGDLFDFYFEYKSQIPKAYFDVLNKLKELRNSGTEIHYIVGNHDFWIGDFVARIGIKIYKKPIQLTLQGKTFFITHGDGLTGFDPLRWVLRNKLSIAMFYHLHPDFVQSVGKLVSNTSSKFSRKKRVPWQKLYSFMVQKFNSGVDVIILAHIHSPKILRKNGKKLAILGDWSKHFSYGKLERGEFNLFLYKN